MNAKTIEGLKALRKGIDLILEGCAEMSGNDVSADKPNTKVEPAKTETVEAPKVVETSDLTREQLEGMTYNNLKKLAKEMGVSAVGNREEITNRILGENTPAETEPANEVVEVPVDEKDNDPVYAKVVEAVEGMTEEEIADILADVGISAKGKRETLIEKLVNAVKDGLIEFDDDEDETEEEDEVPNSPAPAPVEDEEADDEEEEEDDTNDIDNPNMTEARKKAILKMDDSSRKQFKEKKLTRGELVEFLQSFYDTEDSLDDMSDDEVLDTYIDAVCRLIDDDGNVIEEGAYLLNNEPACCGRVLAYSEDTNLFICEHCGEEYEAE